MVVSPRDEHSRRIDISMTASPAFTTAMLCGANPPVLVVNLNAPRYGERWSRVDEDSCSWLEKRELVVPVALLAIPNPCTHNGPAYASAE